VIRSLLTGKQKRKGHLFGARGVRITKNLFNNISINKIPPSKTRKKQTDTHYTTSCVTSVLMYNYLQIVTFKSIQSYPVSIGVESFVFLLFLESTIQPSLGPGPPSPGPPVPPNRGPPDPPPNRG